MTDSRWIASGSQAVTDNTIEYLCISGNNTQSSTTEGGNREEVIIKVAGVLKNGAVMVTANNVSNATPIRLRKKTTTNANPNISVTADTTGLFEDTTNTQTVSADDEYYWSIAPPTEAGTNTITVNALVVTFTPDTTTNTITHFTRGFNSGSETNNNVTKWSTVSGNYAIYDTESQSYTSMRNAFTWQGLSCLTVTYSKGGASTIKSDIDGTLGTQTISITAAGRVTDTTHTDSITSGQSINTEKTYYADANGWTSSNETSYGVSTDNKFAMTCGTFNGIAANVTMYIAVGALIINNATENDVKVAPKVASTWKDLTLQVATNTVTATSTFTSRIDTSSGTTLGASSNGTQTVQFASSTAGITTDSTHSDTLGADNKIDVKLVVGATGTTLTIVTMSSVIQQSTNYTKTFTIDATLKKNLTKTFTIDATLKKNYTKTFTIDTVLKKNYTKTFTADATLLRNYTKTFTVDTVLKKLDIPKTFTIDTVLQKLNNLKTFTIDSVLANTYTKTFTIDAVLKKNLTKTFTVDTVLQKLDNLKTFTVDATLLKAFTKTLTIDTVLLKNFTKTFTIDSTLLKNFTKTFTIDAVLKKSYTKALTIDTVLQKNYTKTFTIDTVLVNNTTTYTKTFTIDAVLQRLSIRRAGSAIKRIKRKLPPRYPEFIPIELHLPLESAVTVPLRERLPLRSFVYQNIRVGLRVESSVFRKIIESLALRSTVSEETNTHTILESIITNGPTFVSVLIESGINRDKMDKIRSKLIDLIGEDYETS